MAGKMVQHIESGAESATLENNRKHVFERLQLAKVVVVRCSTTFHCLIASVLRISK